MPIVKSKEKVVLALNVGSTSIKSRVFVFRGKKEKEIYAWSRGGLGLNGSHQKALSELKSDLAKEGILTKIAAVGHRVVHGGPMKRSCKIGAKELKLINRYSKLAPLHNPFNLQGIREAARWGRKEVVRVAVFDTAFFSGLPGYARTYAIPSSITKKYGLYRYGFHGISHHYALLETAKRLKKHPGRLKLITVHLGGGASIAAIRKGRAVDTSMGFTPLEGLIMSTRSGDIDPGIIVYLLRQGFALGELENILINEGGIKGLAHVSSMLELIQKVKRRNALARKAFDLYTYRIKKYIGSYLAVLGSCDAVVFTGAVGAGDPVTRNRVTKPLKETILKNIPVLSVIPNEEKMIARETRKTIN
jgi:acetate kinase